MQSVDIGAVDKGTLADVSGITFDNSLPQEERAARILEQVKNPYCFYHGDTAVKNCMYTTNVAHTKAFPRKPVPCLAGGYD